MWRITRLPLSCVGNQACSKTWSSSHSIPLLPWDAIMQSISRRVFIQGALAAGAVALTSKSATARSTSSNLRIRRSALGLPATDNVFQQYALAVKKMHELPTTDRRNWRRMAETHADFCQHGTLEFLPWHRHYITQFEKICGDLIGDPQFALPYWDWTNQAGKIPDAFFDIQELNVTYWKDNGDYDGIGWGQVRTIGIRVTKKGEGVQDDRRGGVFTKDNVDSILDESDFGDFTNRLEREPHNTGHVVVGIPASGKSGHIGDGLSPLDPLFWLHHCNVDRLWALWQIAGHATPSFSGDFNGQFVDTSGNPINVTPDQAKDFRAMGFSYDDFGDPVPFLTAAGAINSETNFLESFVVPAISNEETLLGTAMGGAAAKMKAPSLTSVPVENLRESLAQTRTKRSNNFPRWTLTNGNWEKASLAEFARPQEAPKRVQAVLKNVRSTGQQSHAVNVFLNCPYLSPDTPHTDTHWVGTFSFFGNPAKASHDHHAANPDVIVDLTKAIRELGLSKSESLKLQLVPVGSDGQVTFEKVEIRGI